MDNNLDDENINNVFESKSSFNTIDSNKINITKEEECQIHNQIKYEEEKLKKLENEKNKLIIEENERKQMILNEINKAQFKKLQMKKQFEET